MSVVVLIDDGWDAPLSLARTVEDQKIPMECHCRGSAVIDTDRCLWCGRYLRALFRPYVTDDTLNFREMDRMMRERPHQEAA